MEINKDLYEEMKKMIKEDREALSKRLERYSKEPHILCGNERCQQTFSPGPVLAAFMEWEGSPKHGAVVLKLLYECPHCFCRIKVVEPNYPMPIVQGKWV